MDKVNSIPDFFENLDLVNGALLGTEDLDEMMRRVLDVVITVFDCDRAYLQYPCDPHAHVWNVPMERTRPEYSGLFDANETIEMDDEVAQTLKILLRSKEPVTFGEGNTYPFAGEIPDQFNIKSFMATAIYPKGDKPWQFGIHQCSRQRVWTPGEQLLFRVIGRRVADGLSLLLALRDLKESEASYSRFVNMANEGIWALDTNGKTSFVNARMTEMLGYTNREMLGRPVVDFVCEEEKPDYLKKMANGFQGVSAPYQRRYRRKNGEMIWVLVSATGIQDDEGNFIGGFGMVTDITEQKRAEEDLRRLNEELEARVIERTRELRASHVELEQAYQDLKLAHANILQQEKMASIGQLAAGIAHEINTPTQYVNNNLDFIRESLEDLLSGMQGCLNATAAIKDGSLTTEAQSDLDRLLEEIDYDYLKEEIPRALGESTEGLRRIAKIVLAMKEFSHSSGEVLEPVDLVQLIKNTIEITRNSWKIVAEMIFQPPDEPLVINGLRDELGQALLNLIVNAVDAIEESGGEKNELGYIRIQLRESGDWAEIQVEDSGCGIPPEISHKIFEPFFTTKQVGRGSGQGLAITYHIIKDKHGGELQVDSSPGKGSIFTIRLPMPVAE